MINRQVKALFSSWYSVTACSVTVIFLALRTWRDSKDVSHLPSETKCNAISYDKLKPVTWPYHTHPRTKKKKQTQLHWTVFAYSLCECGSNREWAEERERWCNRVHPHVRPTHTFITGQKQVPSKDGLISKKTYIRSKNTLSGFSQRLIIK